LPEGVVARMQVSPYRIQLAGIRTAEVEARELYYEIPVSGVLSGGDQAADIERLSGGRLQFEAAISQKDLPLLMSPRPAQVWAGEHAAGPLDAVAELSATFGRGDDAANPTADVPRVCVRITSDTQWPAGTAVRAVIRVPSGVLVEAYQAAGAGGQPFVEPLVVPETAVVDHGDQQLVFVESMPGTFDAVTVTLGPRCGDDYLVLSGLKPQQRVAVAGAFLIDAETRLNPSLAVAYFGANQASSEPRTPSVRVATQLKTASDLSPEERAQSQKQGVCPVTDLPLDSMGGPVVCVVQGRKIFLCCAGCEPQVKQDPAKYLAKLPPDD
jgi:hypothetical protein